MIAGTRGCKPPSMFCIGKFTAEPSTVWSLGILAYRMVDGNYPFDNDKQPGTKSLDVSRILSPGERLVEHGYCTPQNLKSHVTFFVTSIFISQYKRRLFFNLDAAGLHSWSFLFPTCRILSLLCR